MSDSTDSRRDGEREAASTPLSQFDAWDPIDSMRRCFPDSTATLDTAAGTRLDQTNEGPTPSEEGSARFPQAGDPVPLGTSRTASGAIMPSAVEVLASRIEARLFTRLRQALDPDLLAWMSGAIRDEIMQAAAGEEAQPESSEGRDTTRKTVRKSISVPSTEP